jgi:hypothetical protein
MTMVRPVASAFAAEYVTVFTNRGTWLTLVSRCPDAKWIPLMPNLMWQPIVLIAVLVIAGCDTRRPDFMTRVQEDCLVGQQWACDLINSLNKPPPMNDTKPPKIVGANAE